MKSQPPGRTARLVRVCMVAVALGGLAACFGDDESDAEVERSAEASSADDASGSAATGTLVLGSETIGFVVDACDLAADPPAGRATLSGHAELPDGRTLQVTMLRTPMGSTTWHSVGLDFGTEYREARRGRFEGQEGWRSIATDSVESGLGPLITIDGRRIAAEGTFLSGSGGTAGPVQGTVTATCPAP